MYAQPCKTSNTPHGRSVNSELKAPEGSSDFGKNIFTPVEYEHPVKKENLTEFETIGLEALSKSRLLELINDYGVIRSAATEEVVKWLKGLYKFDPNCLTD